jgi:coenzyme F420 hydrogenase subunit beta
MLKILNVEDVVASRLCHGCGACSYACNTNAISLVNFVEIGIRPVVDASKCTSCNECVSVCSGLHLEHDSKAFPSGIQEDLRAEWGPVLEVWEGHAVDQEIWFKSGSGGVTTALALYALEREGMHGVLHVGMDPETPYLNKTVMSHTRNELTNRTGSRYAPAAVCGELDLIERAPSACVLIGKPCDIAAARMAAKIRPEFKSRLGLTISIFCGGTPSTRGTLEMLRVLGVKPEDAADVRYRGHGWPGMSGASVKGLPTDDRREMTYSQAWDTILTKHKPFRCHICPDGTGEFADISCGDPWYRPIEPGEKGETLIVVRTERGREILRRAIEAGYVVAEPRSSDVLPRSQNGLLMRRRSVMPKVVSMWLMFIPYPHFRGFSLWRGWLRFSLSSKFVSFYRAFRWMIGLRRRGPLRLPGGESIETKSLPRA